MWPQVPEELLEGLMGRIKDMEAQAEELRTQMAAANQLATEKQEELR